MTFTHSNGDHDVILLRNDDVTHDAVVRYGLADVINCARVSGIPAHLCGDAHLPTSLERHGSAIVSLNCYLKNKIKIQQTVIKTMSSC